MSRGSVTSRGRRDITLWLSAAGPRRAGLAGPGLLPRYRLCKSSRHVAIVLLGDAHPCPSGSQAAARDRRDPAPSPCSRADPGAHGTESIPLILHLIIGCLFIVCLLYSG